MFLHGILLFVSWVRFGPPIEKEFSPFKHAITNVSYGKMKTMFSNFGDSSVSRSNPTGYYLL